MLGHKELVLQAIKNIYNFIVSAERGIRFFCPAQESTTIFKDLDNIEPFVRKAGVPQEFFLNRKVQRNKSITFFWIITSNVIKRVV